jgi:hypothetical protein
MRAWNRTQSSGRDLGYSGHRVLRIKSGWCGLRRDCEEWRQNIHCFEKFGHNRE